MCIVSDAKQWMGTVPLSVWAFRESHERLTFSKPRAA